jgi:hypothetical protein
MTSNSDPKRVSNAHFNPLGWLSKPLPQAIAVGILILTAGCMADFNLDKTKLAPYAPEFAIPLAYEETTLGKLVASKVKPNEFYVNDNGFYEFAYQGETVSKRLDSSLKFGAVSFPQIAISTVNQSNITVNTALNATYTNGAELSYMVTKPNAGSVLNFVISNNYNRAATLVVTLLDANQIGSTTPIFGTAGLLAGQSSTLSLSLDNAQLRFAAGGLPNTFNVKVEATFPNGAPTTGSVTIRPALNGLKFRYIEGWLGSFDYLFAMSNNIDVKLFNTRYGDFKDGVEFYNPQIRVDLLNSTGYACQVFTDDVYTTSQGSTTPNYLHLPDGVTRFSRTNNLLAATKTNSNPFVLPTSVTASVFQDSVTRNNSDIGKAFVIFGTLPNKLHYQTRIRSSQTRTGNDRNFFGADSSRVRFQMNAILPCDGRIYRYTALDTFKLDLPSAEGAGLGNFSYADLAIKIENGFPATIYGQLYFADENQVIFDSLIVAPEFSEQRRLMTAAPVSGAPDYRVIAPVTGPIKHFKIGPAKYKTLQTKTRFVMYLTRITGPVGTPDVNPYQLYGFPDPQRRVRVYPDYAIKSQIGVSFGFQNK